MRIAHLAPLPLRVVGEACDVNHRVAWVEVALLDLRLALAA